ncbi:hypothetical protein K501DRAFT_269776 [Backusella circina FSU 941]|nr:hypothetical protein K501DRAFT_269776 [Backusella circina FSU 941]
MNVNNFTAIKYYLKAAGHNNKVAMDNIGICFLKGQGVPFDKFKALEWFMKSRDGPQIVEKLNKKKGIHLKEDKRKTIYQLIEETKNIIREGKKKKESILKEENQNLKEFKSSNEKEMENLRKEIQKLQNEAQIKQQQIDLLEQEKQRNTNREELPTQSNTNLEQQLKDKMNTINSLNTTINTFSSLVQSKDNEINSLKTINHLEKQELKHKIDQLQQAIQALIHSVDNNSNTAIDILDNYERHNSNVDNIRVKVETESEGSDLIACQIGNKKKKSVI